MNNWCVINMHVFFEEVSNSSPSGAFDALLMIAAHTKPSVHRNRSGALEQPHLFSVVVFCEPREGISLVRATR